MLIRGIRGTKDRTYYPLDLIIHSRMNNISDWFILSSCVDLFCNRSSAIRGLSYLVRRFILLLSSKISSSSYYRYCNRSGTSDRFFHSYYDV